MANTARLLEMAAELRALAQRAERLAESADTEHRGRMLLRASNELEQQAVALEERASSN